MEKHLHFHNKIYEQADTEYSPKSCKFNYGIHW